MAKRDPAKTARNKEAEKLSAKLKELLPVVLDVTGCDSVHQLHGKIGSKHQEFMNVKERCIQTSDEFISLYMDGLARAVRRIDPGDRPYSALYTLASWYQSEAAFRDYTDLFLERTFLSNYDELARVKPNDSDAKLWIGQNDADYGLLVCPRFNDVESDWENDKSEIRRFKPNYFTVGHVVETGLVVPGKNRRVQFADTDQYLAFFQDVVVRNAGSEHQNKIAERYAEYVRSSQAPAQVPLLIPELRYLGRERKHKYRLDYCIVDPFSLAKIGFELSPWSSHGRLTGTKTKSVKAVNNEARENFEREIRKYEAYFNDHGIHVTVFTDSDLENPDLVFDRIKRYLQPERRAQQLRLESRRQLLAMDLDAEVENDG